MIEIGLFVDGKLRDRMKRSVVPRVGETIVLDCGEMVIVTEVSHQWDSPDFVQLQAVEVEI